MLAKILLKFSTPLDMLCSRHWKQPFLRSRLKLRNFLKRFDTSGSKMHLRFLRDLGLRLIDVIDNLFWFDIEACILDRRRG